MNTTIMIKLMRNTFNISILILISHSCLTGQVKISDGTSGTINNQAILQLESQSNNKGLLITRIALTATNVASPVSKHSKGLIVYNTATAGASPNRVFPGLYYNDGTKWIRMSTKSYQIGDIKNGFQTGDHDGWYLLDGRSISVITEPQRSNASSLGFSTNLPNSTDRYLKGNQGVETPGAVSGSDSFILNQNNLPNISFVGSTSTGGGHTHNFNDNPTSGSYVSTNSPTNNPVAAPNTSNKTTGESGAHTHTISFSLGGTSSAVNLRPAYLATNVFIYLGN